jgi:CRISPR-associated protein Csy1
MTAFANITTPKGKLSSHTLAKQIYWPLGNGEYHLLAPLFPTSLVDVVWKTIRKDRFSETAKAAREAHSVGNPHPEGYREYPNMTIQKFGGNKPQNISQFNSERYGENYLFPSYPPSRVFTRVRPPLVVNSVFDGWFERRKSVRELTRIPRDLLMSVQNVNKINIHDKRAKLINSICDELLQFAAEIHELPGGWSLHKNCRLNLDEQCWLDPWRAEDDEIFASVRRLGDWRDAVCKRFGNWLDARFTNTRLPVGEHEIREWRSLMDGELRKFYMDIDIND